MAIKYFNDDAGLELKNIYGMDNAKFAIMFPGVVGLRDDGYRKLVGWPVAGTLGPLPVQRKINYKSQPSRHVCDARCVNAKGRTMNCECSCGGVNHGRGMIADALARAA